MDARLTRAFPHPVPSELRERIVLRHGSEMLINVMLHWTNKVDWIARTTTFAPDNPAPYLAEEWTEALEIRDALAQLRTMLDGEVLTKAQAWLVDVDADFVAATTTDDHQRNNHLGAEGGVDQWWRRRVPSQGPVLQCIRDAVRGNG